MVSSERPASQPTRRGPVTIVVPTFNESENVALLVARLAISLCADDADILFVGDSSDDTLDVIRQCAALASIPVSVIHRPAGDRGGGLAGAVCIGIRRARSNLIVVMDGNLQHPPEAVPRLIDGLEVGVCDIVIASRYCADGLPAGFGSRWRRTASSNSPLLARWLFPIRVGSRCSDPMTGFFSLDRRELNIAALELGGFKILFEILASHTLRVREVPIVLGGRYAGNYKASWRQGGEFILPALDLRLRSRKAFRGVDNVSHLEADYTDSPSWPGAVIGENAMALSATQNGEI